MRTAARARRPVARASAAFRWRARRRNVARAFRADTVAGDVLLVDDVYTSGATVTARMPPCGRRRARVDAVTFARAVPHTASRL